MRFANGNGAIIEAEWIVLDRQWHLRVRNGGDTATFCERYFSAFSKFKMELDPGDIACVRCEAIKQMVESYRTA